MADRTEPRFCWFMINLCTAVGWQTIEEPIFLVLADRFASLVIQHVACANDWLSTEYYYI